MNEVFQITKNKEKTTKLKSNNFKYVDTQKKQVDDSLRQSQIEMLKAFDLNSRFGPNVGISRLERWERANKFGLKPPIDIKNLILEHQNDKDYEEGK
ncbi:DNA polymerase delta subunit 4 [Clydaea vesicula]|uniref:DNA polymerase delta subunit 4 n=1 Tax=Clydaea vesicula TaxID=447962 RepID=A0AAD5U7T5_9FUNG|nr:DNA polymerase delta subunit 4 [Clydaea vesicula]